MPAEIIHADFVTKTWRKPESLERLANVVFSQVFPIDGIPDVFPRFLAPEKDGA